MNIQLTFDKTEAKSGFKSYRYFAVCGVNKCWWNLWRRYRINRKVYVCVFGNQTLKPPYPNLKNTMAFLMQWGLETLCANIKYNCGSLVLDPRYNVTRFNSTISHENTANKYKHYKIHWEIKLLDWFTDQHSKIL